jgi:sugar lactone lactonase YvrE
LGILLGSLFLANPTQAVTSIPGFSHPESVAIDSTGTRIFVSNIGKEMNPTAKDADGYISEVAIDGTIVRQYLTPKGALNAPKGLACIDNIVYVADIDRVVGFDTYTGDRVFDLDFSSDTSFLNDLTVLDNRTLLVSASDTGIVYQISLSEQQYSALPGYIPGANGVAYNAQTKTIYAVGLGENFNGKGNLYQLSLTKTNAQFEQINSLPGFLDGIGFMDNAHLIYSDWVSITKPIPGAIYSYDLATQQTTKLVLPLKVRAPADFAYSNGFLWLPQTLDNQVLVLDLSTSISNSKKNEHQIKTANKIELPADFQYPNGITRASNGTLYVGSIVSGKILQITLDGKITTFFPGSEEVFAATSLRLDEQRGILWGTSPDFLGVKNTDGEIVRRPHRVFAIAISTSEVLRSEIMPDRGFGNDLALDSDGGVYITDSFQPRIYYLAPNAEQFQIWAEDELFRPESEQIGLAGIARNSDGITVVGMYSAGKLFKVIKQPQGSVQVEAISLERQLENPDGMQFTDDGSLLIAEGAMESGNGRLVRLDVLSPGNKPKPIKTLASGLKSPVNLTTSQNSVWVTESQIRHRLLPKQQAELPERFFLHHFVL